MFRAVRGRARSILTGAVLAAVGLAAVPAGAYCRTTVPHTPPGYCETGTVVSWGIPCRGMLINPRGLDAAPDAGQDLAALVRRYVPLSTSLWAGASCGGAPPSFRMSVEGEAEASLDIALDGRSVVSVNRLWTPDPYHRPGTVAFTVVTADVASGTLLEADVELNAKGPSNPLGHTFSDGPPAWGVVDAPTVILHELGHAAGLWHSFEAGAVMEAATELERQRRSLTDDDRRGICAVYPPGPGSPGSDAGCPVERPPPRAPRRTENGCSAGGGVARREPVVLFILVAGWAALGRRRPHRCTARF